MKQQLTPHFTTLPCPCLATARQLESITEEWRVGDDKSAEAAAKLVRGCEDVISRENESWMAAWNKKKDKKKSLKVAKA
jgi:uncharacterized protein (DUF2235 family)